MIYHNNIKKGFSFLEIITVIAIVLIIISISITSFSSSNKRQALDKSQILLVSILNEARSLSVAGKNYVKYGVHLGQNSITLFSGDTYMEGLESNKNYELNKFVEILPENISLIGGGSDIVFERGTGQTDDVGSFRVSLKDDPSSSSTINISSLGVFNTR
jgi:prepilin-type N-terminal cleavage/methylation domain-containing protein